MGRVRVYGSFVKKQGEIFRTSCYIQWGNKEDIIGAIVMCKPGNGFLRNISEGDLAEGQVVEGEVKKDPSIHRIIKIVENMKQGENLNGRLIIYSLFTLKNTNVANLVKKIVLFKYENQLMMGNLNLFKENKNNFPWIIVSWGCDNHNLISLQKQFWLEYIKDNNIIHFGRFTQYPDCYQVYQHNTAARDEVEETIINQYRKYINKTPSP
jgi:hypothetical protein